MQVLQCHVMPLGRKLLNNLGASRVDKYLKDNHTSIQLSQMASLQLPSQCFLSPPSPSSRQTMQCCCSSDTASLVVTPELDSPLVLGSSVMRSLSFSIHGSGGSFNSKANIWRLKSLTILRYWYCWSS